MTDSARRAEGLSTQPVRILAIGDLIPENGYARLLELFAGVARCNRLARLIIVGEGPERAALEGQIDRLKIADHVGLPGRVSLPHLAEWLQRTHIFVSAPTGHLDCLAPGVAVAMTGGICIVATECGGIERVLEDGVTALLVDPEDEEGLSRALHLAVSNTELRRSLGEAAATSVRGRLRKSA